ncbi:MAG: FtsX-like permease family protein [Phycisphaerae bacterium]|jgi:ABC-type lipoprotein release transport system permease subunit
MYKLFLCLRYLRKRLIAVFAMLAVWLCVAMVLIVMSVMGGFLDMVRDRSRGMLGDLVVESATLQGFPFYQEFIDEVKTRMPGEVVEATPVIITYGVLRFSNSQTKPVQVVGIRLEETYRVNDFKSGLFYEKYYPGTTRFDSQAQPAVGLTREGHYALPPELEAARRQWEATASRQEFNDAWRYPLFQFPLEAKSYPRQLNRGELGPELRAAITAYLPLPEQVEVGVARKGKKWVLRHRFGWDTIRLEDGKLIIGRSPYAGPGYYSQPASPVEGVEPVWSGRPLPGIIMGTDLCAERLRSGEFERVHYRGEQVQLTLVPFSDTGIIERATGMPSKLMRYVDDCRTGVYEIDSMSAYVDFDLLQDTVNMTSYVLTRTDEEPAEPASAPASAPAGPVMPARTTQVQIKLAPALTRTREDIIAARNRVHDLWREVSERKKAELRDAPEVLARIEGPLRWVRVQTWEEKQARFIAAVEKEKYLVTFLFGIISVVAVLLVGVIFYMIVQQKTRDIGIIKSVGATSAGVAGIFLGYGAAVGVVGGALGTATGALVVWFINDIQDLLISIGGQGAQVWNPEVYNFDKIPNVVKPLDAAGVYVVAIAASVIGSLLAAWKASRVWPVEALRYE